MRVVRPRCSSPAASASRRWPRWRRRWCGTAATSRCVTISRFPFRDSQPASSCFRVRREIPAGKMFSSRAGAMCIASRSARRHEFGQVVAAGQRFARATNRLPGPTILSTGRSRACCTLRRTPPDHSPDRTTHRHRYDSIRRTSSRKRPDSAGSAGIPANRGRAGPVHRPLPTLTDRCRSQAATRPAREPSRRSAAAGSSSRPRSVAEPSSRGRSAGHPSRPGSGHQPMH